MWLQLSPTGLNTPTLKTAGRGIETCINIGTLLNITHNINSIMEMWHFFTNFFWFKGTK